MEKQKLNPLEMVAREMSEFVDMDREHIEKSLIGLLLHLNTRALHEIDMDPHSDQARSAASQYRVACEAIALFGTQLIAFEDMDDDLPTTEDDPPTGDSN